jgi:predicted ATP-grasp superfamily ATP-dependent carboligase
LLDQSMNVILVGASTRAAACSALRARLRPICADLFADHDLADRCQVSRVAMRDYPEGLIEAVRASPPGAWAYVGAIENHPDVVDTIAAERPLWGNGGAVLRRVRDPFAVAECLARAGLPHPQLRRVGPGAPRAESWLVKPLAGAGGRGIGEYGVLSTQQPDLPGRVGDGAADETPRPTHFLQERISGVSCAAVFVANGRDCVLLGATRQLVGEPTFHAKPFHYCGSVGPMAISRAAEQRCEAIGATLASEFGLMGLFGVDAILRGDEVWPVEVNPRYTASMEIVEHALQSPLFGWHRDACTSGALPAAEWIRGLREQVAGVLAKAVLFAPCDLVAPDLAEYLSPTLADSGAWPLPLIADIPPSDTPIAAGQPILTVFAAQPSPQAAERALIEAANRLYRRLGL